MSRNPLHLLKQLVYDVQHTYTHPPERVILIACLAFTTIGTRQIVAQLAFSTSMQAALALVHIYKTHTNGKNQ